MNVTRSLFKVTVPVLGVDELSIVYHLYVSYQTKGHHKLRPRLYAAEMFPDAKEMFS